MSKLAVTLLFSKSVLISAIISIIFIFYGDYLIKKYNLESKYPKLATFIKYRRQFQKYYLISSCLTIFIIIFSEIVFCIAVLL